MTLEALGFRMRDPYSILISKAALQVQFEMNCICQHLPSRPNSVDIHPLCNVDDKLDVGIIVVVRAARYLDVVVCHSDIVGVGL